MRTNEVVVYTALMDGYDFLRPAPESLSGVDFICFSNCIESEVKNGWKIQKVLTKPMGSVKHARMIKILPHIYLPRYEASLWVDANILIRDAIALIIDELYVSNIKIATFRHPFRQCIYDEAAACIDDNRDCKEIIQKQVCKLREERYPLHNGLAETNVLYRRHNDPEVIASMEEWARWVLHYSKRDQLSFNYVMWKLQIPIRYIAGSARGDNPAFLLGRHRKGGNIKSVLAYCEAYRDKYLPCAIALRLYKKMKNMYEKYIK